MDLHPKFKAIFILIIIFSNLIIFHCQYNKSNRYEKLKTHRNSLKGFISLNFILEKLKEIVSDPENIIYFALGVMSVFNSSFDTFYKKIKTIFQYVRPCFEIINEIGMELPGAVDLNKLNENQIFKQVDSYFFAVENKEEYCNLVQEEIRETFIEANGERNGNSRDWKSNFNKIPVLPYVTYWIYSKIISDEEKCKIIYLQQTPKTQNKIVEIFGSLREYEYQCIYFSGVNCEDLNSEQFGLLNFILKVYNHYKIIDSAKTCIINLITSAEPSNPLRKIYEEYILNYVIDSVFGFFIKIFDLDYFKWMKIVYDIINLGYELAELYERVTEDLPFKFGQIFGKVIIILKSLFE